MVSISCNRSVETGGGSETPYIGGLVSEVFRVTLLLIYLSDCLYL